MGTPHKHAALIKQWADGADIQYFDAISNTWHDVSLPGWKESNSYRIKPVEITPDTIMANIYSYVNSVFNNSIKVDHPNQIREMIVEYGKQCKNS